MTRTKEAKLDYWLLCDMIRREDNGKLIIVGLYAPDIVVQAVPVMLPMLSFLFKWDLKTGPLRAGSIVLKDPAGSQIFEFPIEEKTSREAVESAFFAFGISPFGIEKPGTFTLIYGSGNRSSALGSFRVILQQAAKP
jgi:hypothetical protein